MTVLVNAGSRRKWRLVTPKRTESMSNMTKYTLFLPEFSLIVMVGLICIFLQYFGLQ
jgi:hypothetical protein